MDATAAKLKQLTTPLVGAPGITDYLGIGKGQHRQHAQRSAKRLDGKPLR